MAPRPRAGAEISAPDGGWRAAAALVLLYPANGTWHIPLTVRGAGLRQHSGQVSLPGGRVEVGETPEAAALREASEEIGVEGASVEVLGRLSSLEIPVSGHLLHPIVGAAQATPTFRNASGEVDRLLEIPLSRLADPGVVKSETWPRPRKPQESMIVPFFELDGEKVWGATAMVLAELLAVLDEVGKENV